MGNQLAGIAPSQILSVDSYFSDIHDHEYDKSLGSTRFFKVARAKHREGLVVVKVFAIQDPSLPLTAYKQELEELKIRLHSCQNCLPFQKTSLTEKAAILFRQYVRDNLYDRISTRPFLNNVEKRWIAFQLLNAVDQAHKAGVRHGDIKTENVMVTSWNWVLLTDFASFKPTYLPEDNPADFNYFFDTSRRRTCYIASERFVDGSMFTTESDQNTPLVDLTNNNQRSRGELRQAMDIFSAGCVIAELFTEGVPLFDLSQLLAYRKGHFQAEQVLLKIEDRSIRELVAQMVQREPEKRLTAEEYLKQQRGKAFPDIFYTFLQPYMAQFAKETFQSADERVLVIRKDLDNILHNLRGGSSSSSSQGGDDDGVLSSREEQGLVVLVSVITSCLQTLHSCDSKLAALELILHLALRLSVDILLDRITPYLLHFCNDPVPRVRAQAVRTLTKVLALVKEVPRNDVNIYPEYILPGIAHLAQDDATIVRLAYAENIAHLAESALRFLELVQENNVNTEQDLSGEDAEETNHPNENYDSGEQNGSEPGPQVNRTAQNPGLRASVFQLQVNLSFTEVTIITIIVIIILILIRDDELRQIKLEESGSSQQVSDLNTSLVVGLSFGFDEVHLPTHDAERGQVDDPSLRRLSQTLLQEGLQDGGALPAHVRSHAFNTNTAHIRSFRLQPNINGQTVSYPRCCRRRPPAEIQIQICLQAPDGPVGQIKKASVAPVAPAAQSVASGPAYQRRINTCKAELQQLVQQKREQCSAERMAKQMMESAEWESRPPPPGWHPKGLLVAHLHEHKAAVNRIRVSDEHAIFATASNDGSIKVWDSQKMEGKTTTTRSVVTYSRIGGHVKTLTFCQGSHYLAVASDNGSVQLLAVEANKPPKSPKVQPFQSRSLDLQEDGCVVDIHHFNSGAQSVLAYATVNGSLVGWDLRSNSNAWMLRHDLRLGLITSFSVDMHQCWLCLGTSSGTMACWDMRFQLPISNHSHPARARVRRLLMHPLYQSSVIAAVQGNNEVSIWDMETGDRKFTLWASSAPPLSEMQPSPHSVHGIYCSPADGNPLLLTAGSDMRIRFWDLAYPERSYIVAGGAHDSLHCPSVLYSRKIIEGTEVVQEIHSKQKSGAPEDSPRRGLESLPVGHHDIITDIATFQTTQGFIVTSSRDGIVKVWK
ncbi:phosphoinositide 3-kinase regulatory subunit 4 [Kryptolebias marmoratus]|uniref:phosphoinositide 3-kinase regulatory subunit 4 n=1 Tax=Kryptolebias marmoratus TaxID=37003 RepID=UPI0018ACCD66|nr:phosphoinositide 3-kinase regulatory subunit 4 [Kryptolebias marmoratus]